MKEETKIQAITNISEALGMPVYVLIALTIITLIVITITIYNQVYKRERHEDEIFSKEIFDENRNPQVYAQVGDIWYYKEVYKGKGNSAEYLPWPNANIEPVEIYDIRENWVKVKTHDDNLQVLTLHSFYNMFMMDTYNDLKMVEEEVEEETILPPYTEVEIADDESAVKIDKSLFNNGVINIDGVDYALVKTN